MGVCLLGKIGQIVQLCNVKIFEQLWEKTQNYMLQKT